MSEREDRYVVSIVEGHKIDPRRETVRRDKRGPTPLEASILDSANGYQQVASFSTGGLTAEEAILKARRKCHLLNLDERRWESGYYDEKPKPDEPQLEPPAPEDMPSSIFGYMCEKCQATVPLTRAEFNALRGRVRCDRCVAAAFERRAA